MISFVRQYNRKENKERETNYSECQTIYKKRRQKIL
jgi:hypothetical protein